MAALGFRAGFRVYHLLVKRRGFLCEVACEMTSQIAAKPEYSVTPLTQSRISELLQLGSIYLNEIRQREDCLVDVGDYIRLHADPRRFSRAHSTDWRQRLIFENDDFVVVNKPAGVPVHAMVDNSVENVIHQNRLQSGQTWHVTHRLDVATQGLVIYGKTKEFQARFNRLLREGRMMKIYSAITEKDVPLGLHIHHMEPNARAPRVLHANDFEGALRCELEVLGCERLSSEAHQVSIRLITGRTHQIRCQMAFLGAPIWGDQLYKSTHKWSEGPDEEIALQCRAMSFTDPSTKHEWSFELPSEILRNHLPIASQLGL